MLSKARKAEQILEMSSHFEKAKGNFIIQFQGLSVQQMSQLRSQLRAKQAQMRVMRNTLVKRALENHSHLKKAFSDSLSGANAFVFSFGDAGETAKILSNFCEESQILKIKKATIGSNILLEKDVLQLASLPSLNELRAQLISVFSTGSFVQMLGGVSSAFVRVLANRNKQG